MINEEAPLSEYVKMCLVKQIRNEDRIKSFGTGKVSPKTKEKPKKIGTTSKRLTKCSYNHNNYSLLYKEDNYRRYCTEGNNSYSVELTQCGDTYSDKYGLDRIVPSVTHPIHVCLSRNKFKCRHAYCYMCFQRTLIDTEQTNNCRQSSWNKNTK